MDTHVRIGHPMFLTIDQDARRLLLAMMPNSKGRGCFLSELIRKEARERTQRAQHLATLHTLSEEMVAELERAGLT